MTRAQARRAREVYAQGEAFRVAYKAACAGSWPRMHQAWTYGEDQHLLAMIAAVDPEGRRLVRASHRNVYIIAHALGRTCSAVQTRLGTLRVAETRRALSERAAS